MSSSLQTLSTPNGATSEQANGDGGLTEWRQDLVSVLIDAIECAKQWGVSVSGWYTLVRNELAPPADAVGPLRWYSHRIDEMKGKYPAVEEVEKDTDENGRNWVCVGTGDFWGTFWDWQQAGLVTEINEAGEGDYKKKAVRCRRQSSTRIVSMVFIDKSKREELVNNETARRRASAIKQWDERDTFVEKDKTLVTERVVLKMLGIDHATVDRWSDPEGDGCPYLKDKNGNKPLKVYFRDANGNPMPRLQPGKDGVPVYKCWDLQQIETVKENRDDLPSEVDGRDLYSIETTAELTGIPISTLENKKKLTDLWGLVRIEVPVKHIRSQALAVRKTPMQIYRIAFTKTSVDKYAATHPNLQELVGTPGTMTTAESDERLGLGKGVSWHWCKDGLLDHHGKEKYWTNRGLRKGYRPTEESVKAAEKMITLAGDDRRKAEELLRAQREEERRQKATDATPPITVTEPRGTGLGNGHVSAPPADADETCRPARGRPSDPDVARRKDEMLKGWEDGKYKSKAAAARAHDFHRADASKLIDEYMKNKSVE
jgi:hypothetical protein